MIEIEVKKNFEWDCTENKLTIFIPCYKNIDAVEFTIKRISTIMEPWDYTIIIGNDGFHHHWGKLTETMIQRDHPIPVKYFSLLHKEVQPRNSCFIRNYALKRCMSEYFLQKDDSVVLTGDFPLYAVKTCEKGYFWRVGNINVLSEDDSCKCIGDNTLSHLGTSFHRLIEPVTATSIEELKEHLVKMNGQENFTTYFQYAFCAPTQFLKGIRGYDEAYKFYGFEDIDMFCRLTALGKIIKPDYNTYAYHLCHPCTVNEEELASMQTLFRFKNPEQTLRNPKGWGNGKRNG